MHICLYTLNSMTVIYIERNHEGVWRPWLFARCLGEIIPVLDFPQDAEDFKIGIIWGTVFLELINCIFLAPLNVLLPVRVLVLHWEPKLSSEFSFEFMFFNVFNGSGADTTNCYHSSYFCLMCVKISKLLRYILPNGHWYSWLSCLIF